jgi:hypothetical protein
MEKAGLLIPESSPDLVVAAPISRDIPSELPRYSCRNLSGFPSELQRRLFPWVTITVKGCFPSPSSSHLDPQHILIPGSLFGFFPLVPPPISGNAQFIRPLLLSSRECARVDRIKRGLETQNKISGGESAKEIRDIGRAGNEKVILDDSPITGVKTKRWIDAGRPSEAKNRGAISGRFDIEDNTDRKPCRRTICWGVIPLASRLRALIITASAKRGSRVGGIFQLRGGDDTE